MTTPDERALAASALADRFYPRPECIDRYLPDYVGVLTYLTLLPSAGGETIAVGDQYVLPGTGRGVVKAMFFEPGGVRVFVESAHGTSDAFYPLQTIKVSLNAQPDEPEPTPASPERTDP